MSPLNPSEIHSEVEIKKRKVFDKLIERRHGTSINSPKPMKGELETNEPNDTEVGADTEPVGELPDIEDILDSTGPLFSRDLPNRASFDSVFEGMQLTVVS